MSRIGERFARLRRAGEKALVPFVTAGDPDLATTAELVVAIAAAGADAIELGVPFSDPIADGPTIQRASQRALGAGTTLRRILALVKQLRPQVGIPMLLMGYANPFHALGVDGFVAEAASAGVDGVISVSPSSMRKCCQIIGRGMAARAAGSIVNIASTYGIVAPDQ